MSDQSLYCTFYIGRQFYGIPVSDVQEVLQGQFLTRAPLAPPAVAGLMNLRGQIVTTIDVRRVMCVTNDAGPEEKMNLVIRHEGAEVSLLVDRIGDVVQVDGTRVEQPPETLQGVAREFIRGICQRDDGILLLIDADRMLSDESCTRSDDIRE